MYYSQSIYLNIKMKEGILVILDDKEVVLASQLVDLLAAFKRVSRPRWVTSSGTYEEKLKIFNTELDQYLTQNVVSISL